MSGRGGRGRTTRDRKGRYRASGLEAESEPGSRGRVLRNLLGIRSAREMARRESAALVAATERLVDTFSADHGFTAADVCEMHREWLGEIYPWAGQYRGVNLSKGDVHFAAAREIPRLMSALERGPLARHTPLAPAPAAELGFAMAEVHGELVLIHPFREGNGRCARLLSTLMALQAGLPPLDFGNLEGRGRGRYFAAIGAVFEADYEPLSAVFRATIERSLRSAARASAR